MTEIWQNVRGWTERTALPRNVGEKRQKTAAWSLHEAAREKRRPQSWIQKWGKPIKELLPSPTNDGRSLSASGFTFALKKNLIYQVFTLLKLWTAEGELGPFGPASHQTYITSGLTFSQSLVSRETDVLKWKLFYFCTSYQQHFHLHTIWHYLPERHENITKNVIFPFSILRQPFNTF